MVIALFDHVTIPRLELLQTFFERHLSPPQIIGMGNCLFRQQYQRLVAKRLQTSAGPPQLEDFQVGDPAGPSTKIPRRVIAIELLSEDQ